MFSRRYDAAIEYTRRHWQEGHTLKAVAGDHGVDPGDLDREFRRRYGMTVHAFMNDRRKEYVRRRVCEKGTYAYQIGFDLGFQSDWSFYRWVRRAFGTPYVQLKRELAGFRASGQGPRQMTAGVSLSCRGRVRLRGDAGG